jgi:transposase
MGKPYADDLRLVVVRLIEEGHTRPEVAELCGISLSTVGRYIRRYRVTSSISPARRQTGWLPLIRIVALHSPDKFGGYKGYALAKYAGRIRRSIARTPDLTLLEIQARLGGIGVKVAASSVFRFLRHLGLTFKALHAAEQDRPDVAAMRRRWQRSQRKLDLRRLVFIDETAVSTGMTRRGCRCARGERLVCKVPFGTWQSVTMVAALRHDRITAPMMLNGAMTAECFRSYIAQVLGPTLRRSDIDVMDNVPVRRTQAVREALEKLGVSVPAFPAYSPDFNPIEQAIAKLKAHLRKLAPRSPKKLTTALRDGLQQFTPAQCAAFLRHSGYSQPKRSPL